jgi:hypothetical protein
MLRLIWCNSRNIQLLLLHLLVPLFNWLMMHGHAYLKHACTSCHIIKTLQGTEKSSLQFCHVDWEIVTGVAAEVDSIAGSDEAGPKTWIMYTTAHQRYCESIKSYGVAYNCVWIKLQKLKPTKTLGVLLVLISLVLKSCIIMYYFYYLSMLYNWVFIDAKLFLEVLSLICAFWYNINMDWKPLCFSRQSVAMFCPCLVILCVGC